MEKSRNQMFDILKFMCSLLIVYHHLQMEIGGELKYVNFSGGAFYFGFLVELYFIISGFLMYQYIKRIQDGLSFKDFFKRRFFRYTPIVTISVISFNIIGYTTNSIIGYPQFILSDVFTSLITCLSIQTGWCFNLDFSGLTNYALWYISVLQLCYILFYVLTYIATKMKINYKYLYFIVIILGICFRSYKLSIPLVNFKLCRGYYSFFFGILFAEFIKKYSFYNIKLKFASFLIIITGVLLGIYGRDYLGDGGFDGHFIYLLTFIFYPSIIYFISSLKKLREYIDKSRFIKNLGDISFTIYVFHVPLIYLYVLFYYKMIGNMPIISNKQLLMFSVFVISISSVIHLCIEKPLNRLVKEKIIDNKS